MAELMQDEVEYGWDEVYEVEASESLLLPDGDYGFTVTALERERFEGSEKVPPCNRAVVSIAVDTPQGTATVRESFLMLSRFGWKLAQFFKCLGAPTNPETGKVVMAWNSVVGQRGRAKVGHREYNGNTYNEVKKWLEPAAAAQHVGAAPAPAQQQMPGMPAPSQPGAGGGFSWS